MDSKNITTPIENRGSSKGNPNAIIHLGEPLNKRQERLLNSLREIDDNVTVHKSDVSMKDLAALTAHEGVEFALFTRKGERMIIRGDVLHVNIDTETASQMSADGWRWSGHTHPGAGSLALIDSEGDRLILRCFTNQSMGVIYNSKGRHETFAKG